MLSLRLETLCNHAKALPFSHNMMEDQSVINSGMIIMYRTIVKTSDKIELYASCLQTSALILDSHIITGTSNTKNFSNTEKMKNFVDIMQMHRTCKADSSHSCKYVVAVLLFCNR